MLDWWEQVRDYIYLFMREHGYWTLFLAMAIEGLGLPIPMEFLFIPAGFSIARRELNLAWVTGAATLGSLAGNLGGYALGSWGGRAFLRRYGHYFRIHQKDLDKVNQWLAQYGGRTVFAGRFIGFLRAPSILAAGIGHMPLWDFALFSALAGLVWNGFWAFAALQFGRQLPVIVEKVRPYFLASLVALVGVAAATYLVSSRRRRTHPRKSD